MTMNMTFRSVPVAAADTESDRAEGAPPATEGAGAPLDSGLAPEGSAATAARVGPALEDALALAPDALADALAPGDSLAEGEAALGDGTAADGTPLGAGGVTDEPAPDEPVPDEPAPDDVPFPAGGNVGGIPSTVEPGCGGRVGPPALWPGTALASCAWVLQPVGVMTSLGLQM